MARHQGAAVIGALAVVLASGWAVNWASPTAHAAVMSESGAAGVWKGQIELPGMKLDVVVTLKREAQGLTGTIDIPQQGASGLALKDAREDGAAVTFVIEGVPGIPTFVGNLDGATLKGDFTQGGQKFPFSLTRDAQPAFDPAKAMDGFDAWVEKALVDWEVPGLGVAVVADGKVLFSKGYGKRNVESDLPVTPDTLFAIGSSTKAFTTYVLATLVAEGKIGWDMPVVEVWPEFKLSEPERTRLLTPRDMATHRSGLPRHDLSWYNSGASRAELIARMAHLDFNYGLREQWQYNNFMFLAAGVLGERLTGKTWEDNVRERIFTPLGMNASNFNVEDSQRSADFAVPYDKRDGKMTAIPFRNISQVGPAGSINSSVNDMARWVQVQLGGKLDGNQIMSEAALDELHAPAMIMQSNENLSHVTAVGYGLGWFVDMYRGERRVHHGGNIDGFTALVFCFPNKNFGGVILANRNGTPLPDTVSEEIADRLLQLPSLRLYDASLSRYKSALAAGKKAEQNLELLRKQDAPPSHALSEYVGEYTHPGYGSMTVAGGDAGAGLTLTYNRMSVPLLPWHYDTFTFGKSEDPAAADFENTQVLFRSDLEGNISAIEAQLDPSVKPIVFERAGDASLRDPATLEKFVGKYVVREGLTIAITRRDATLVGTVPGQPPYDLDPLQNNTFKVRVLNGYRVRFKLGEDGQVTGLLMIQPGAVFDATREKD